MIIFTICSNNYLGQAIALGNSIKRHNPEYDFEIFLCDEKSPLINYNTIEHCITEVSKVDPCVYDLAKKYNIIELNTAVKPTIFEYLFENRNRNKAIYLDPDVFLFDAIYELEKELNSNSILLTPHIFNPILIDGRVPSENTFLNYGIYNLGFLALKKDENSEELLKWWKNITYNNGFINPAEGVFVDQLPMNMVPLFFSGVKILKDVGYNMAPWNLHERYLDCTNNAYLVNGHTPLKFYHFSSFNFDHLELPTQYNRYRLSERSDLIEIYKGYNDELNRCNYQLYKAIPCVFVKIRNLEIFKTQRLLWKKKSMLQKLFSLLKKNLPDKLKSSLR